MADSSQSTFASLSSPLPPVEGSSSTPTLSSSVPQANDQSSSQSKMLASTSDHVTTPPVRITSQTGAGEGKPKAFMIMCAEGSKKAPNTPHDGGSAKGGRKSKGSTPKSSTVKSGGKSLGEVTPAPTRSSQRQIKRPKTDDELIDFEASSRSKKHKASVSGPKLSTTSKTLSGSSSSSSQKKTSRPRLSSASKALGRWKPTDDLMLINAVLQTNDLAAVHIGVKFSCRFTLREIEERWYALLYDSQISKLAIEAIRGVPPGVVTMALNNSLWSQEEEALLSRIPSTDPGQLETFQKLLADHPAVFNHCRTATSLHHHWVLMGHYCLLYDQNVDVIPPGDSVVNFTDAEDLINDTELMKSKDVKEDALEQELMLSDRQAKRQILRLEEELPLWKTALDIKTIPEFESGVFAILKGRVVQFMMRAKEVTIGRNSGSSQVTFDLSLEGPAYKISRKQATITIDSKGVYHLHNNGRRPMYLSGQAVVTGQSAILQHNHTLEVATLSFVVFFNPIKPALKSS